MENKGPLTVKELKNTDAGKQVWGKFIILDKILRRTKEGKEMHNLKIGDTTGNIDVVVWDNCNIAGEMEIGVVIGLLGDMGNFAGKPQITAKRIKILEEDPSSYLKSPEIGIDKLKQHFIDILNSIEDSYMKELLNRIFTDEYKEIFFKAPAAKSIHHNYTGGLLEHTVFVSELCRKIAEVYSYLNKDLLVTGAILHDIGKTVEYEIKVVPRYTVEGKLIGHIVKGSEFLEKNIEDMRKEKLSFPEELKWMLKHMILSHHGSMEFGSPVIPLFPEAFVLHMMDNLDAKLFVFASKMEEPEGEDEYFTNYDHFFQQQFFKYRY